MHAVYHGLTQAAPILSPVPVAKSIHPLRKDTEIVSSPTSAQHMAMLQASAPTCTPDEAHAPSSRHLHMLKPWPRELSSEVHKAGEICLQQTSSPVGDVCLNIDGQLHPLQSPVNLKQTQAPPLKGHPTLVLPQGSNPH